MRQDKKFSTGIWSKVYDCTVYAKGTALLYQLSSAQLGPRATKMAENAFYFAAPALARIS